MANRMKTSPPRTIATSLQLLIAIVACSSAAMAAPPPAVAVSSQRAGASTEVDTTRPRFTAADVQFMQHMIGHHGQALVMTELVPSRTQRENMRLLAERIAVSQRAEMEMMQRWLKQRGQALPAADASHDHMQMNHGDAGHEMLMPGMLNAAELEQLRAARGSAFDRLFLKYMIRHHEGALTMVAALFTTNGAAQDPETFRFAADVDADQRAEIKRMRTLLTTISK
jgi:uncharacterized protein (DUF305 family)